MKIVTVDIKNASYPIIISANYIEFLDRLKSYNCKFVVITDSNVARLHVESFLYCLKTVVMDVILYVVKAGEKSKCIEKYNAFMEFLLSHNVCRNDVIVTFGGGVIGDLGGFAASTYMRGINLIHVPSSLLSQVDSSIGGKNGVDYNQFKNYIGTFYQPKMVYVNYSLLKTLPKEEIKNGLIEILVHAIIKDYKLFMFIENNVEKILCGDPTYWEEMIYINCIIKARVVEKDEKDKDERAILNFGHTFGHAIESAYNYKYSHGRCVTLGIIGACFMSEELNLIDVSVTERIVRLLKRIGILTNIKDCNIDDVFYYLKHDKKNIDNNLYFILLTGIGEVKKYINNDEALLTRTLQRVIDISTKDNL